ncbi:hydroxyacid dehydrogenase [Roseomonas sp. HJA6]|uniref:Hydroxyacid dehydrogenase n=1 Tax=Roseomonas alba TaxID=2846776 RepID=A0ABS7AAF2_9PROT|nr:hydroxyacid dehydrogenase [Neoroseomonas alba]MBW6399284.1 hydroxyacid dehydrogenase [Neoroseomonas alba]
MPIVVVSSPIHPVGIELLRRHCEVREVHDGIVSPTAMRDALRDADGVIVRSLEVTAELLAQCPRLKIVAKHGAGVDSIDVRAATERGILVANSGNANALGVAEGAVALMLAVLRRVPEVHAIVAGGGFAAKRPTLIFDALWEATVGVIGFGNVGQSVAKMCGKGFDATVLAYDPAVPAETMHAHGAEKMDDLAALLGRADIVTLHLPLMPATRHLIGPIALAAMKPGAILVNTSRGGVVDEAALIHALCDGTIRAAGIDVFEQEPPAADNPLFSLPNVVLSPHVAGATWAARRRAATRAVEAVLAVLSGRRPEYVINPDVLAQARAEVA